MKIRFACLSLAVLASCSLSSCASLMTGETDTVTVQSVPPGASFTTNTGARGRTPQTIVVPASDDLIVNFRMNGHEPQQIVLSSRMSAWILGNVVFGGFIGLAVDLINPDARTHSGTVTANMMIAEGADPVSASQPAAPSRTRREVEIREIPREIGATRPGRYRR